jgi:hybrid polyketide synthase / nonribosomal peptide synthetase ACE1
VIGHTEGTAGVASVIGTMLALKNHVIPQNLHFHNLNPSVAPYYRNLEVPTTARPWNVRPGEVRRASVNRYAVIIKGFNPEAEP